MGAPLVCLTRRVCMQEYCQYLCRLGYVDRDDWEPVKLRFGAKNSLDIEPTASSLHIGFSYATYRDKVCAR